MSPLKLAAFAIGFVAVAFVMLGVIALWASLYWSESRRLTRNGE